MNYVVFCLVGYSEKGGLRWIRLSPPIPISAKEKLTSSPVRVRGFLIRDEGP